MKKYGFTLLEIIVSLVVISVITTLLIPYAHQFYVDRKKASALKIVKLLRDTIDIYAKSHNGAYPRSLKRLVDEKFLPFIPDNPLTNKKDWQIARRYYEYDASQNILKKKQKWVKTQNTWADFKTILPRKTDEIYLKDPDTSPLYWSYYGVCNVRSGKPLGIDPAEDLYGTTETIIPSSYND